MNRVALVTGGSRGLGRATAISLGERGVDVIITYHSKEDEARSVADHLSGAGVKAAALQLDVGRADQFPAFVKAVKSKIGEWGRDGLNYLVNNAGVGAYAAFAETTESQFDQMMNVHLKGPFFLTQGLLPVLLDEARIINISSGLARFSYPGYAAYATMKGGIEVLTRYMAKELGSRGIAVNTVAPGAIETDFGGGAVRDNKELNAMIASETALGRVGLPEDIGGMISTLLTSANRWINGQRIEVAGGIHL